MKAIKFFVIGILTLTIISCTSEETDQKETLTEEIGDDFLNQPAVISGKILNRDVYPHINEVKLTIPGFRNDETVYFSKIDETGAFHIKIYPKTQREIRLEPIEDVIVVQPGDSLFLVKDFKDIGNTSFSGNRASLNQLISKFRKDIYLGRYSTDYSQTYLDFKNQCEKERNEYYQRLTEFQKENNGTDEFNNWAIKRIELDYYEALFNYPDKHLSRSGQKFIDSQEYYDFMEDFKNRLDNSIVMTGYFKTTEQYLYYQVSKLFEERHTTSMHFDTVFSYMMNDLFVKTENNYLGQFTLRTLLNSSLTTNNTELVDQHQEEIAYELTDDFLRDNLREHYRRVDNFRMNPRLFSDAILGSSNQIEPQKGISTGVISDDNFVKNLIDRNPGKVIYINFWAPWCPPCIHYLQFSPQLMSDFENEDVEFMFVCINSNEENWKETLIDLQIEGQHIYCNVETTRAIRKRFGFSGVPYYLLINKEGVIVDYGLHLNEENEYTKMQIEKYLNE